MNELEKRLIPLRKQRDDMEQEKKQLQAFVEVCVLWLWLPHEIFNISILRTETEQRQKSSYFLVEQKIQAISPYPGQGCMYIDISPRWKQNQCNACLSINPLHVYCICSYTL